MRPRSGGIQRLACADSFHGWNEPAIPGSGRRSLHQSAGEEQFHPLERNAVAGIAAVVAFGDAAVLFDEEIRRQQVVRPQPGEPHDAQALQQRRHARDDGLELAPARMLDAVGRVRGRGGIGDDRERSRFARDEAAHVLGRGGEHGDDVQAQRLQRGVVMGEFVDAEVAERASGIAEEAEQRAPPFADRDRFAFDVPHVQAWRLLWCRESHALPLRVPVSDGCAGTREVPDFGHENGNGTARCRLCDPMTERPKSVGWVLRQCERF